MSTSTNPPTASGAKPTKTEHDPYTASGTTARFDPDHLALYFRAPTQSQALEVAQMLLSDHQCLDAAPAPHEVVVTHADDWDWDHTITATSTRGAPPPSQTPTRSAAIIALANALRAAQAARTTAEHTGDQQQWTAAEAECMTWARALSAKIR